MRDEINNEGKLNTRRTGADKAGGAMMANLERNEDLLRMDPSSGLGELADKTGGFLIQNTNDLRGGFTRIESDMRNYYMLTYVPKNDTFDGKFREINVKVKRGGVSVHSRKGYYAVHETRRSRCGPTRRRRSRRSIARRSRTRSRCARRSSGSPRRIIRSGSRSSCSCRPRRSPSCRRRTRRPTRPTSPCSCGSATRNKQVIDKVSQRYQVAGPIEKLDQAKNGQVVFYRQPELPPGFYTMETVVYDALAKKASVRFTTIEQPTEDTAQLRMSSLMLVSRGEHAEDAPTATTRSSSTTRCCTPIWVYPSRRRRTRSWRSSSRRTPAPTRRRR